MINLIDWNYTFGGSTYYLSRDSGLKLMWNEARLVCELMGAHLVKIETEEDRYLQGKFGSKLTWIGATDGDEEGTFRWTDGTPLTYSNWDLGQPDDAIGEDCAQYWVSGKWNDNNCGNQHYFICKEKNDV